MKSAVYGSATEYTFYLHNRKTDEFIIGEFYGYFMTLENGADVEF
jgi:hypothetical protein